jgi:hypothetical protein
VEQSRRHRPGARQGGSLGARLPAHGVATPFVDADGRHPCHSFFYPAEEYRAEHLDKLASLCRDGYGEIEIHLHHDNDTAENLAKDLRDFANTLHHQHGALSKDPETGEPVYAFIHGNWCLDNSRPDGRWCGVNNEITVLRDTGCYADFTFPAAPDPSQPPIINSIYHVNDDPLRPCSHFSGEMATAGQPRTSDLLLINGPLMLNWKRRKFGIIPRIENGDIRANNPPTPDRVDLWVQAGVRVRGRDDWLFVKIHTHGAQERDMEALLGEPAHAMHRYLQARYNDGGHYRLHYVSAREMYNIARARKQVNLGTLAPTGTTIFQDLPLRCAQQQRQVQSSRESLRCENPPGHATRRRVFGPSLARASESSLRIQLPSDRQQ